MANILQFYKPSRCKTNKIYTYVNVYLRAYTLAGREAASDYVIKFVPKQLRNQVFDTAAILLKHA